MTIFYVANMRLPTEKVHGIQIMKMCEQFTRQTELELVVPKRSNFIREGPFSYYKVDKKFKIKYIPVVDLISWGRFGFWIESLTFSVAAFFYLLFKKTDIIYGWDEIPLCFLSFFKKNIFWEIHQERTNLAANIVIRKTKGVIIISEGLKNFYGRERDDILTSPDAVDFDIFNSDLSKEECRRKLGLPPDKKIVLYSGHLYVWKDAGLLAEAASEIDAEVYLVGGTKEDIDGFKGKYKTHNLHIVGHRAPGEIPLWLKSADILVLPNSGKEKISSLYTSPLKLFEYMASGTPIVSSDLSSKREIVSEKEVIFF